MLNVDSPVRGVSPFFTIHVAWSIQQEEYLVGIYTSTSSQLPTPTAAARLPEPRGQRECYFCFTTGIHKNLYTRVDFATLWWYTSITIDYIQQ